MKIALSWNNPIPRLTTVSVGVACITFGVATPTWGQMATTESMGSSVGEISQQTVPRQEFPAVSPEILQLISQGSDRHCNLHEGESNRQNVNEVKNPDTHPQADFLQQLNCVFFSRENVSQAAGLQDLQVDYRPESSQVFQPVTAEANPAEILAQGGYFDGDRPKILLTPKAGLGGRKGVYVGANLQVFNLNSNNGTIDLDLEAGEKTVGASLTYTDPWFSESGYDFGYRINVFNTRNPEYNFLNGDREVNLVHGHTPWVDRLGAGVEFFQPVSNDGLILAYGANYQRVAIRNRGFSSNTFSRDELGNRVTVGNDGLDPLFSIGVGLFKDGRDNPVWPTEGYRFRVSTEQSIPIGDDSITMNRLVGSYSKFLPMGENTIALGVQAGTIIGDAPPYEAFGIGGGNSVRGYGDAELGSARSFLTTAVEYRFLIADELEVPFLYRVGGTFFLDIGTDLGSGDTVIGEPAEVRQKPGNGFGGGAGVRLLTDFGQVRVEAGLNNEGDFSAHVKLGDRF